MNRRDVLRLGVVGFGAAFAGEAEASDTPLDTHREVARLRRRLDRTAALDLEGLRVPPDLSGADRERAEIDARLIRSTMRTLLVTGTVMDLGDAGRSHPDVHALAADMGPELDHAVEGMFVRLATLPQADRARVRQALADDPAILDQVAMEIEQLGGRGGASPQRRLHLRNILQQVTWRLKHQPIDLAITEVLEKTFAQSELFPDAPRVNQVGEWGEATARVRRAFAVGTGAGLATDDALGGITEDLPEYDQPESKSARYRKRAGVDAIVGVSLLAAGAIMLGIGVAADSPVLIIASLFVFTAVVVMLVLALVMVIIAASAAEKGL